MRPRTGPRNAYHGARGSAWRGAPPFGGDLHYAQAERVGPRKSYPLSEVLARRGDLGARGEYAWN